MVWGPVPLPMGRLPFVEPAPPWASAGQAWRATRHSWQQKLVWPCGVGAMPEWRHLQHGIGSKCSSRSHAGSAARARHTNPPCNSAGPTHRAREGSHRAVSPCRLCGWCGWLFKLVEHVMILTEPKYISDAPGSRVHGLAAWPTMAFMVADECSAGGETGDDTLGPYLLSSIVHLRRLSVRNPVFTQVEDRRRRLLWWEGVHREDIPVS